MYLAAVASARQPVAVQAYFSLISPALQDVARGALRRALHDGMPCRGVQGSRPCDMCEQWIADHVLAGYEKLRAALTGDLPKTRNGDPVREMRTIVEWVTAPAASTENLGSMACLLRRRPSAGEPAGLRAARAQLVHHPLRNLEARVRREQAQARGASARPDRDLITAAWAAPLRKDPIVFALLVDAVLRLRHGSRDLYGVSSEELERHGLDIATARRLLRQALTRLRVLRPEFYMANVVLYLSEGELVPWTVNEELSPEDVFTRNEETEDARRELSLVLAEESSSERRVLERICAAATQPDPELLEWAAVEFGVDAKQAEVRVRELVRRICQAGLEWVTERCESANVRRSRRRRDISR